MLGAFYSWLLHQIKDFCSHFCTSGKVSTHARPKPIIIRINASIILFCTSSPFVPISVARPPTWNGISHNQTNGRHQQYQGVVVHERSLTLPLLSLVRHSSGLRALGSGRRILFSPKSLCAPVLATRLCLVVLVFLLGLDAGGDCDRDRLAAALALSLSNFPHFPEVLAASL